MIPMAQQKAIETPNSSRRFSYPRGHSNSKDVKLNASNNFTSAHRSMPLPQQHRGLNDFEGSDTNSIYSTQINSKKENIKINRKLGIIMDPEIPASKT